MVLLLHVLGGATWVGASACFVLAASALAVGGEDGREFALNAAPIINRVNLGAALVVLLTGITNLFTTGALRRFGVSRAFSAVLATKITLFCAMVIALAASWRAERLLRVAAAAPASEGDSSDSARIGRLARLYALTALMGATALALGLWLAGS